jgi:hypothetical protein
MKRTLKKVDEIADDILAGRAPLRVIVKGAAVAEGQRQKDLARAAGVAETSLCSVLNGRRPGGVDERRTRDHLGYPAGAAPPEGSRARSLAEGLKDRSLPLPVAVVVFCRANGILEGDVGPMIGRRRNAWLAAKAPGARSPGVLAEVRTLVGYDVGPGDAAESDPRIAERRRRALDLARRLEGRRTTGRRCPIEWKEELTALLEDPAVREAVEAEQAAKNFSGFAESS